MNAGFGVFCFLAGLGFMFALPIWAYCSQKARVEVEREKTKQLELQLHAKRHETSIASA